MALAWSWTRRSGLAITPERPEQSNTQRVSSVAMPPRPSSELDSPALPFPVGISFPVDDPPNGGIAPHLGARLFGLIQQQGVEGIAHYVITDGTGSEVGAPEGVVAPAHQIAAFREESRFVERAGDAQQGEQFARAGRNRLAIAGWPVDGRVSRTTEYPHVASRRAAADPAGPPPTMMASKTRSESVSHDSRSVSGTCATLTSAGPEDESGARLLPPMRPAAGAAPP